MNEGLPALTILLILMEAGVPIPLPSDVLILVLGERTSAGKFPLLLVVLALELVAAVGTAVLFVAVRGPGRATLLRFGPKIGLTEARLNRATGLLERRGTPALFVGRATPGLRTVTVVAAGTSTVEPTRALWPMILGSTVFVQTHLFLGYFLGPAARDLLDRAKGPTTIVLLVVAAIGAVYWIRRRGTRRGLQSTGEACCPACLALGTLAPKAFKLEPLA